MNANDIFSVLLYSKIKQIIKMIFIQCNDILNTYGWKLLYFRNYKTTNIIKSYDNSYVLCHKIKKTNSYCYQYLHLRGSYYEMGNNMISCLINLKYLYVEENKLITIMSEIGLLINLKIIDVSNNELICLPTEISLLTNIKNINTRFNRLQHLPSDIKTLVNLTDLDLFDNNLTTLPTEISLLNLETIRIDKNNLVTATVLYSLVNLVTLSMDMVNIYDNKILLLPKLRNFNHRAIERII